MTTSRTRSRANPRGQRAADRRRSAGRDRAHPARARRRTARATRPGRAGSVRSRMRDGDRDRAICAQREVGVVQGSGCARRDGQTSAARRDPRSRPRTTQRPDRAASADVSGRGAASSSGPPSETLREPLGRAARRRRSATRRRCARPRRVAAFGSTRRRARTIEPRRAPSTGERASRAPRSDARRRSSARAPTRSRPRPRDTRRSAANGYGENLGSWTGTGTLLSYIRPPRGAPCKSADLATAFRSNRW